MRGTICLNVILCFVALSVIGCSGNRVPAEGPDALERAQKGRGAQVSAGFGRIPLFFEENRGQADRRVKFLSRGGAWSIYMASGEIVMVAAGNSDFELKRGEKRRVPKRDRLSKGKRTVSMQFVGGSPGPTISGTQPLPGKSNYFIGNDPDRWLTKIPHFARVRYERIYPGVDLEVYGHGGAIEYDFIVAPGVDPATIELRFSGDGGVNIDGDGNLVIITAAGEIIHHAPRMYQSDRGERTPVKGRFVKRCPDTFGFAIAAYDAGRTLVIDPEITFGTYLGGTNLDEALGLAVDPGGNAYVAGRTFSDDFPVTVGAHDEECGFDGFCDDSGLISDIFVTKMNAQGTALLYSTYVGGSGVDSASGIAIDSLGNAYVAGRTESDDFPLLNPFQFNLNGSSDAFLLVLNDTGSGLIYSTYFGGSGDDEALAVAVPFDESAFIIGSTTSIDFHTENSLQTGFGGGVTDAFVARFDIDVFLNTGLPTYSTYLGGSEDDIGRGIAADSDGDIYVTGETNSDDFPTKNPIQTDRAGGDDAFAAKIDTSFVGASAIVYSTYLGGAGSDTGCAIGIDSSKNAYLTGTTASTDFPLKGPFQSVIGGSFDAFVAKVNASGSTLTYSTFLGGNGSDEGSAIAVTSGGLAYVTGRTGSTDFPVEDAIDPNSAGSDDVFLTKLLTSGTALEYSTYLGGSSVEWGKGVALEGSDKVYVAGYTDSDDFPVTAGAFEEELGSSRDAFVVKIDERKGVQRFDVVEGCGVVTGYGGETGMCLAYVILGIAALSLTVRRRGRI